MKISSTNRTVTEFEVTLSAEETILAKDHPREFGKRVQKQLRDYLNTPAANAQKGKTITSPPRLARSKCPACSATIAKKYMDYHRRTKHAAAPASDNGAQSESVTETVAVA